MCEVNLTQQTIIYANEKAEALVTELLASGTAPDDIADALIVKALAVWAADVDRKTDAVKLLAVWTEVRDSKNGSH